MKVLLANKFFFHKGGSEAAFFGTARVLREHGHKVVFFSMDHPQNVIDPGAESFVSRVDFGNSRTIREKISAAGKVLYSLEARRKMNTLLRKEKPDLVHVHNIHHQISPSILSVIKKYAIPVVMTLHDYKMVCPVYTLLRHGQVCEKCSFGKFYQCFVHRCCKESILKSLLNTMEMYFHHTLLNLYGLVDLFISPSRFLMDKIQGMGFEKTVFHLPNFIDCRQFSPLFETVESNIVYFGRLSKEKGLHTLLDALKGLKLMCRIYGDGPLKKELEKRIREEALSNVSLMGHIPLKKLKRAVRESVFAVVPSEWYENNPFSILEAFACGKPVIGSKIGGIPEMVLDSETGFLFDCGKARSLQEKMNLLAEENSHRFKMGKNARRFVEENFSPEKHYIGLMKLYEKAASLSFG